MYQNTVRNNRLFCIRKYFDLTPKGKELIAMLEGEIENTKLRKVVDYEISYIIKSFESELDEKEKTLAQSAETIAKQEKTLAEKENQINLLKAKLEEKVID